MGFRLTALLLLLYLNLSCVFCQPDDSTYIGDHRLWLDFGGGPLLEKGGNFFLDASYIRYGKYYFNGGYSGVSREEAVRTLVNLGSVFCLAGRNYTLSRASSLLLGAGPTMGIGDYYVNRQKHVSPEQWFLGVLIFPESTYYTYDIKKYRYLGLMISAQYLLRSRCLGLGIRFYANIHKYPDAGFTFSYAVGSLRKKKSK